MMLDGHLAAVSELSDAQRHEMFSLMDAYYEHIRRVDFESDLNEKQWVILLQDSGEGTIRGFSTQRTVDVVVDGQPVRALFSGDTIVTREYWSHNPLAQIWGRFALMLIDEARSKPLYWFLMSKGYKTYRFLPVFFHEYYPRSDLPTPRWVSQIIDALGRHKYPSSYDSRSGIVRADRFGCRLRSQVAEITPRRLRDPHIRFFAERNPGHARGDELCCIAPLTRENFTDAAYRVIGSTPELLKVSS